MAVAAMAAFAVMASAQDDIITPADNGIALTEGIKAHGLKLNPLAAIQDGVYATEAIIASKPMGSGGNLLQKRQSSCPVGTGECPNGRCCPKTQLCRAGGGCCDMEYQYACGASYCCKYNTNCKADGSCGCAPGTYTCGGPECCKYGCDGNKCACAPGWTTRCSDNRGNGAVEHSAGAAAALFAMAAVFVAV
ncbi:hypothetical protein BGZ94_004157 [Podila epigama]|nr:hypothetical protein BGZ94_004157 [Podila epigama]